MENKTLACFPRVQVPHQYHRGECAPTPAASLAVYLFGSFGMRIISSAPLASLATCVLLAAALGGCVDGAGGSQTDTVSLNDTESDVTASCSDGTKNGDETDKDCGGSCGTCAAGSDCVAPSDCATGYCGDGVCAAASCADTVLNGDETDVDCGGSCGPCGDGGA